MPEHAGKIPHRRDQALNRAGAVARAGIVNSGDLTRKDREALVAAGYLRPLLRGWYHLTDAWSDFADPYQGPAELLRRFLPVYLEHRLASTWCLSPVSSLELALEPTTVPECTTIITDGGGATSQTLPDLGRLIVYPDPERLPPDPDVHQGLRMMRPDQALIRLRGEIWTTRPLLIKRALAAVHNWRQLTAVLAKKGQVTTASRLCGALEEAGMGSRAQAIKAEMNRAGLILPSADSIKSRSSTADRKVSSSPVPDWEMDLVATATRWQESLQENLPQDPAARPALVPHLAEAGDLLAVDTWHSLRLSGLALDLDLVRTEMAEAAHEKRPI